jgi:hypothetical protein
VQLKKKKMFWREMQILWKQFLKQNVVIREKEKFKPSLQPYECQLICESTIPVEEREID